MTDNLNWPRYQCHEVCQAIVIADVTRLGEDRYLVSAEDPDCEPITITAGFYKQHVPRPSNFLIRYANGDLGYEPASSFTKDNHILRHLHFGGALAALRSGEKVRREGWNGKGLWVELQQPDEHSKMTLPYLYLCYPNGNRVPWAPTQTDLLENDWEIVP
ncbi:DUF2829 domain-containing protein [Enterobacter hormaechei]